MALANHDRDSAIHLSTKQGFGLRPLNREIGTSKPSEVREYDSLRGHEHSSSSHKSALSRKRDYPVFSRSSIEICNRQSQPPQSNFTGIDYADNNMPLPDSDASLNTGSNKSRPAPRRYSDNQRLALHKLLTRDPKTLHRNGYMKNSEYQWKAIVTEPTIVEQFGANFSNSDLRNCWLHMLQRHWEPPQLTNTLLSTTMEETDSDIYDGECSTAGDAQLQVQQVARHCHGTCHVANCQRNLQHGHYELNVCLRVIKP
jgi:hypothetical protein